VKKLKKSPSKDLSKDRKLLFSVGKEDCRWDYYRGSGKGGQKRNKTDSAVRCTHIESKAVGQAEDGRKQSDNKKLAFKRMAATDKFRLWLKMEYSRRTGKEKEIEDAVEKSMHPRNFKVDIKDEDGKWTEVGFYDIKEEE